MFRNLCLFAHFDQDNILADYVPYYLEAIRAAGFDIVVISTSDLSADDILRLRSVAHDVILRENNGHDFASWALGIERYASLVSGQLMIANDSVYGPIGDLIRAIERLTSVSSDVYGMIEKQRNQSPSAKLVHYLRAARTRKLGVQKRVQATVSPDVEVRDHPKGRSGTFAEFDCKRL